MRKKVGTRKVSWETERLVLQVMSIEYVYFKFVSVFIYAA